MALIPSAYILSEVIILSEDQMKPFQLILLSFLPSSAYLQDGVIYFMKIRANRRREKIGGLVIVEWGE